MMAVARPPDLVGAELGLAVVPERVPPPGAVPGRGLGLSLVRDFAGDDRNTAAVRRMTLEHYPGMTEKSIEAIVNEARGRWKVLDALVVHRVGALKPTDQIVLVIVASGHRGDAFAACEFIMDFLKTRAPFWKKEKTREGARWVDARATDDLAAERWQAKG